MTRAPLPIDEYLDEVLGRVRQCRAVVVTAAPGAGKTTRIPPALAADGPLILLQPRRLAARAIAERIAEEQGWTVGGEVGWQIRLERRAGPSTRLLVVTEGILTARLQRDPLLSGFRTIVLDEFHERSVHADLGLAMAREAWRARDDLRLVVMSATLDVERVAAFLGGCPAVAVPGRPHPVVIEHAPGETIAKTVSWLAARTDGNVLAFLPGAPEIRRALDEVGPVAAALRLEVVPLHGALDASAQQAALRASPERRLILATNIAETSLTVPGVRAVVDTGLQKVSRYDPERAIDSLELERVTRDSADQRAGRAGRLGPGRVVRLWDARDRLRPHREPEIARIDLSAPVLDIISWGGDPLRFEWFEPPPPRAIEAALKLLGRLGAIEAGRLTPLGEAIRRLPLHPRLGCVLVAGRGTHEAAAACALLSERHFIAPRRETTACDLLAAIDDWRALPARVRHVASRLERIYEAATGAARAVHLDESDLRRALLAGYRDRVARRRAPADPRVLLASGHGAIVSHESGVVEATLLVALDVQGGSGVSRVRLASRVEPEWITPTARRVVHVLDEPAGAVRAIAQETYDEIVLSERFVAADPALAGPLLARAWLARDPSADDRQLLRRLAFADIAVELDELVGRACAMRISMGEVDLVRHLAGETRHALARLAPETLRVPSGRDARLTYDEDGSVSASVRLQELFGLAESPRLGPRSTPVTFLLLAPNGRPVQTTRDLRSFWNTTYGEVRKQLRARYPKHPWPEDPWTAMPTARTIRRQT